MSDFFGLMIWDLITFVFALGLIVAVCIDFSVTHKIEKLMHMNAEKDITYYLKMALITFIITGAILLVYYIPEMIRKPKNIPALLGVHSGIISAILLMLGGSDVLKTKRDEVDLETATFKQKLKDNFTSKFAHAKAILNQCEFEKRINGLSELINLARESDRNNNLNDKKSIFEYLCNHVRMLSQAMSKNNGGQVVLDECKFTSYEVQQEINNTLEHIITNKQVNIDADSTDYLFHDLHKPLQYLYLNDLDLIGANFSQSNLQHAKLTNVQMGLVDGMVRGDWGQVINITKKDHDANLNPINFKSVDFSNSTIDKSLFTGVYDVVWSSRYHVQEYLNMQSANFNNAKISNTEFDVVDLIGAKFDGTVFENVSFAKSVIDGGFKEHLPKFITEAKHLKATQEKQEVGNFRAMTLVGDFSGTDFTGLHMYKFDLTCVSSFQGCIMDNDIKYRQNAKFSRSLFETLEQEMLLKTEWQGIHITGDCSNVDFSGLKLKEETGGWSTKFINNVDLRNANFDNVDLKRCMFASVKSFAGASFKNASLKESAVVKEFFNNNKDNIKQADLKGIYIYSECNGIDFSDLDLSQAKFSNNTVGHLYKQTNPSLENSNLTNTNFTETDLSNVQSFKDAIINQTDFTNAIVGEVFVRDVINRNELKNIKSLKGIKFHAWETKLFENIDFSGVDLTDASFSCVLNLTPSNCQFFDIDFTNTILDNAEFAGADFRNVIFNDDHLFKIIPKDKIIEKFNKDDPIAEVIDIENVGYNSELKNGHFVVNVIKPDGGSYHMGVDISAQCWYPEMRT